MKPLPVRWFHPLRWPVLSVRVEAMKKRSKAGSNPAKARPRKALRPKGGSVPKVLSRRGSAPPAHETEAARLSRELRAALEQQSATAEVLKIISRSTFNLQTVLDTLVESAARLCDAERAFIFRPKDGSFHFAAGFGYSQELKGFIAQTPLPPGRGSLVGRTALEKRVIQIEDTKVDPEFTFVRPPNLRPSRTMLGVPLIRDGTLIGVMGFARAVVKSFKAKETELAITFGNQAVIAIENVRLLGELRESLQEQMATVEVLRVISSSPGDLQPVFAAMLEKAASICDAAFGNIYRWDGDALHLVGTYNTPPAFAKARERSPIRVNARTPVGRMLATKKTVHIADLVAESVYTEERDPIIVAGVELGGIRTLLLVPLLKENQPIGVFSLYRQEVRPFTDKQIELVKNFANQAVIAVENARLLNELRHSLEQQTATSEVLGVISRSRFELQPVLQSVVDTAARLCRAKTSGIFRLEGGCYRLAAASGVFDPAYFEIEQQSLISPGPGTVVGRAAMNRQVVQIEDAWSDPLYEEKENAKLGGVRSMIGVPLMREGEPIGVLGLARTQVEPFVEREVELVRTFADQAVIAIENARLLTELRERTDQLHAQSKELAEINQQLEQRVADQVGEIERMGRLPRFLPPQVADLIVASGAEKQLESHRREITALFCDLRGFTGFTESADAEDVMALLREYHAAIGEIIIKYNGTLERYAGDGVMVVFNDPVPVENPALQAVLMALELRDAIGALTETWSRLGHEIGFGIGVAHGFATLGTIGFEGRFDYAAIGTVSNVASRLCDEAKPGQILISPRVLMAVKDAVTVEPVGEFELKGIRRPLPAYNVLAAIPKSKLDG
jgi:GAF domain-containing protein